MRRVNEYTNTRLAGLDLLSLGTAYATIHRKLVRSYALEGLVEANPQPVPQDGIRSRAREFLGEIASTAERQFASVGHGTDCRYKGKGLAGTALVHQNEVIHAAFFRLDEPDRPEHMPSYHTRRRNFTD